MVNPGDYIAEDEHIEVELLDSEPENARIKNGGDDSDFEPAKTRGGGGSAVTTITKRSIRGRKSAVSKASDSVDKPRRPRGRPRKNPIPEPTDETNLTTTATIARRGRRKKVDIESEEPTLPSSSPPAAAASTTIITKAASVVTTAETGDDSSQETPREDAFDRTEPMVVEDIEIDDVPEKPKPRRRGPAKKKSSKADSDEDYGAKPKKGRGAKTKQKTLEQSVVVTASDLPKIFDIEAMNKASREYPDNYWIKYSEFPDELKEINKAAQENINGSKEAPEKMTAAPPQQPPVEGPIEYIDSEHPLKLLPYTISDQSNITGISLSPDGLLLATFSSTGTIKLWEMRTFKCIKKLRDADEPNIDEYFVGQFLPDGRHLIAGGKLKDRKRWSEADEDNHILPCPLKIFDIITGKVVSRLEGHAEEILCIKYALYQGENYLLTTSQDGYINRWHMGPDWITLKQRRTIDDGVTCMAFGVSFVPNTGNRYFMAATDDHIKLMDLDKCKIVQSFSPVYSSYCDCGKFVNITDDVEPALLTLINGGEGSSDINSQIQKDDATRKYAYFITRGVELLDAENNTVSSRPNTCTLHKLLYPTESDDSFELEEIKRFHHEDYLSNSWLIRITSNGRYLLAPTLNGQVFVYHMGTGQVTAILRDHECLEVRDLKFHPFRKLLFTSADDGTVKIYSQEVQDDETKTDEFMMAESASTAEQQQVDVKPNITADTEDLQNGEIDVASLNTKGETVQPTPTDTKSQLDAVNSIALSKIPPSPNTQQQPSQQQASS
ncbi:hypothetical protein H4219_003684 [Mycoemilia scoparia]|uniref:Uncharacterized protein n=1 Tax=Mycoemilia scoparia TaxID=417184 RepID=A0A9W8DMI3_9FUNG|nr:hypothetical protein H4219_003684 [Mycoemilia scoparia]